MRAMAHIDFYFDFSCPYAYIGSTQIAAIAQRHGASLTYKPMLLGGVFRSTGLDGSPMESHSPAKARHNALDMMRWADHFGIELTLPPSHPMRTVRALRALLAIDEAHWPAAIAALYRAYWVRNDDITQPQVIAAALGEAGVEAGAIDTALAANDDPAIKAVLRERTDEAVARGVFGAPTIFVSAQDQAEPIMLWGQDRLHMVEAVLGGWRPGHSTAPRTEPKPTTADSPCELHYWYDFSSPFAYLGSTQVERIAEQTGAKIVWRPMLLGAIFKQIDQANVPLFAMADAKRRYLGLELGYWSSYWQVPFQFTARFPMNTVTALRLALLAGDDIAAVSHSLFRALWVDDCDLNDPDVLVGIMNDHGFDGAAMLARTKDPATKQLLIDNTSAALEAGVFGAPTSIVHGNGAPMLFWGQDRLEMVADALRGWRPSCG